MKKLCVLLGMAAMAAGLMASPAAADPNGGPSSPPGPHRMPYGNPPPSSAPVGAHLTYYGGRILSNAKVQGVYWGSGSYEPGAGPGQSMPGFFNAVGSSEYFDWLTEYNTSIKANNGQQGTNQLVGHARSIGETTITPAAANDGTTIDDTNMQAELASQLTSGGLPAPLTDGKGNVDTLYALFFPQGHELTQGGTQGGVSGGFCAYHGTIRWNGLSVPYMVLPDFLDHTNGSDYTSGCGSNPTLFNDFTSVTSHELVESTTDAEVGVAGAVGPPLAWYDQVNGEIGDICNGQQGSIAGYVVQQEFSNKNNNCIVTPPAPANDFSVSPSPSSLTIVQGNSATSSVSTAVTKGSLLQTITMSVGGVPAGASASFSSSSVAAGLSDTLTVNAGSAVPGVYTLNVSAANGAIVHTTPVDLTVTPATGSDFAIVANPAALTTSDGSTVTSSITSTVIAGSPSPISLTVSGTPSGMTATLNPSTMSVGSTSTLTIGAGTAAPGVYPLTVTAQNAQHTHTTTVTVTVKIKTALSASALHNTGFHPTARLTRKDTGAPIAGQAVSFKPKAGSNCSAVTNSNGVAQCSSVALDGFTASYAGSSLYLPSSATGAG